MFKEFKEFALKGNVIDMGVGIIIGTGFSKIVTSFVNDIMMPPLGLLLGHVNFTNLFIDLSGKGLQSVADAKAAGAATINYGIFINSIIDFILIGIALFILIKQINRFTKKAPSSVSASEPTIKQCKFCFTDISIHALRCPNCTSQLTV